MYGQERALAVHGDVARAAFDLLAAVQTALLAFGCRLDGLAVQDRVARQAARATQRDLAPAAAQHRHRFLPDTTLLPAPPMVVDRVPRRKVVRQRPPAAAFAQAVEHGLNDAPLRVLGAGTTRVRPLEEACKLLPLPVAQITGVAHAGNLPAPRQTASALTQQIFSNEFTIITAISLLGTKTIYDKDYYVNYL